MMLLEQLAVLVILSTVITTLGSLLVVGLTQTGVLGKGKVLDYWSNKVVTPITVLVAGAGIAILIIGVEYWTDRTSCVYAGWPLTLAVLGIVAIVCISIACAALLLRRWDLAGAGQFVGVIIGFQFGTNWTHSVAEACRLGLSSLWGVWRW